MLHRIVVDSSCTAWGVPQSLTSRAKAPVARKSSYPQISSPKTRFPLIKAYGGEDEHGSAGYLTDIMVALQQGDMTPEEAAELVGQCDSQDMKEGNFLDIGHEVQLYPEIIDGTGKTPEQVAEKMTELGSGQPSVLAVRIPPTTYATVRKLLPGVKYHAGGQTLTFKTPNWKGEANASHLPGSVAIVAGDTEDNLVAEECRLVAEHLGCYCFKLGNLKSTNLRSFGPVLEGLQSASVVVVISGKDRTLGNIMTGIVASPVISVPTSAGHKSESAAMLMMSSVLMSSSLGVTVVGLDDGCAAAFSAARVLQTSNRINKLKSDYALKLAMDSVERASDLLPKAAKSATDAEVPSCGSDSMSMDSTIDINSWGAIDSEALSISSTNAGNNGNGNGNRHNNGNTLV